MTKIKKGKAENSTREDDRERMKMKIKQGEEKRSITRGMYFKKSSESWERKEAEELDTRIEEQEKYE